MQWVLPEYIRDVLPDEAVRLESLRRALLDKCRGRGYQLVAPPLLEYLESLLTGAGHDLDLRTFKLVDQLTGRSMGVRADITPQVARIDAHLLNRKGVSRLCYCGSVLHALPASQTASREPLQLGVELYGHAGLEADAEVIRLMFDMLSTADVRAPRVDLGHMGLFRALASEAGMLPEQEELLFRLLQTKDVPALKSLLSGREGGAARGLLALPSLYGDLSVLARARAALPDSPAVCRALDELEALGKALNGLPLSFDLADLRGYHYHTGVVFAAYGGEAAGALALGGRYDAVGESFGRARAATGFSLDLRQLADWSRQSGVENGAVLAPFGSQPGNLSEVIAALRGAGEIVMDALPGHEGSWREAGCDRQLVWRDGQWLIEALGEED